MVRKARFATKGWQLYCQNISQLQQWKPKPEQFSYKQNVWVWHSYCKETGCLIMCISKTFLRLQAMGMFQGLSETEEAGSEMQAKSLLSEDMCQSNF